MNPAPILASGFTIESIRVPDINTDLYNGEAEDDIYYLIYIDVTADAERISNLFLKKVLPLRKIRKHCGHLRGGITG